MKIEIMRKLFTNKKNINYKGDFYVESILLQRDF